MKNWQVFLLFTLLSVFLFFPIFLGKVNLNGNLLVSFYGPYGQNLPYKNTGWDQLRIYFPFLKVTLDELKSGHFSLWNPYAFSGHPHLADFQTAVFYPLNIFGFFLDQITMWHLLRITPTVLAAVFTYLFLKSIGLGRIAAFFGAMVFGFSPFILTWGEEVVMSPHSIVWMPLILFGINRYLDTKRKIFLAIISLSFAFSLLGGYMQTTIYLFIFVFIYLIFRVGAKSLFSSRSGFLILSSFVWGGLIAALQLLPSAELYFNAARSQVALRETLFGFLLPIEALLTYLAPDFFGHPATGNFFRLGASQYYEGIMFMGVATLVFAAFAILSANKKSVQSPMAAFVKLLTVVWLVSLSTTIDLPTSRLFLSLPIPFLSTSIANRILFIPAFCLAVIGAIGLQVWLDEKSKKIVKICILLAIIYAAVVALLLVIYNNNLYYFAHASFLSKQNALVSLRNLVVPLAVLMLSCLFFFIGSFRQHLKEKMAIGVILVAFLQIFYFSGKYLTFNDRKYIFPSTPVLDFIKTNQGYYRSWGGAFLENNFASQYGIFWPEGYDSLNNRRYGEFTFAMQGNDIADFIFRSDAGLGRKSVREQLENKDWRRLLNITSVKYVIAKNEDSDLLAKNGFKKVYAQPNSIHAVFENLEVLPRVFLASNYEKIDVAESDRQKIINRLLDGDFNFREGLVLEKDSPISPQAGEGEAKILSYRPQEVVIRTKSQEPKILFLSDNFYPGWKVTVDGDQASILRADYTFRAVPLVGGEHVVRFYYDSEVFKVGLAISLVSLGVLGFFVLRKNWILG